MGGSVVNIINYYKLLLVIENEQLVRAWDNREERENFKGNQQGELIIVPQLFL